MSLWLQSFVWELEDEENEKKKMAITIKYLSMPIPRSWWEHSLENGNYSGQFFLTLSS